MTLRCLIVDDSHWFLCAARHLLESQGIAVVGVASNSAEALRRAAELHPDVTLVDIDLGGESGLDLARQLHRQPGHGTTVILISTRAEQDYADIPAAASDFVNEGTVRWGYVSDGNARFFGHVFVNCQHRDTKSSLWTYW